MFAEALHTSGKLHEALSALASAAKETGLLYAEIAVYIGSRRGGHSTSARYTECLGEVDLGRRALFSQVPAQLPRAAA